MGQSVRVMDGHCFEGFNANSNPPDSAQTA